MADQAHGLRVLAHQTRREHELGHAVLIAPRHAARTLAVTSGKGGVGKTYFATNLALLLARAGEKVAVLDADLGLANIHVVLGIAPPFHLEHVMRGEKSVRDILYPGPAGIQIIAGGSSITELAQLDSEQRQRVLNGLADLDDLADVILIDTGAGLAHSVLAFAVASEEVVIVTTPEPTAITDAYATLKVVSQGNPEARLRLVVNMAENMNEAHAAAEKLRLVARQFLNVDLDVLGYLPRDATVSRAVRAQQPFVLTYPDAPAARALARIADTLGYHPPRPGGFGGFLNRVSRHLGSKTK